MSAEEDYSHNIDDQLLKAVKQEGVVIDPTAQDLDLHHHQQQLHHQLQQHHHQQQLHHQLQQHHQQQQQHHHHQLPPQGLGHHQPHDPATHHQQHHFNDDNEFNIRIPEPIINSKLKIYPVQENTITAEGNLITKPYPDQTFNDRKELNDFIAEFARDNGFGVVIAHSNKKAIYYTCELGGRYRDKKNKKAQGFQNDSYLIDPNTKTKKLRCPFAMTASYKKSNQNWILKVTCNEHNHPQLDPLSNHPMLRKRSSELNMLIVDLYKVGTKPSHIESKIREQYPDILIKREDIYNEIRGYKRKLKRENGYMSNVDNNGKRSTAASFHHVNELDDEDDYSHHHHHHNDDDLERLQQAAAAAVQQHQNQQHPQPPPNDIELVAASMAAVANANNNHGQDQISMDNIDSRLVGE